VNDASSLGNRIEAVRTRIVEAANRAGRHVAEVVLVAIVKNVADDVVREAVRLGLRDLGENRVQEAEGHVAAAGRDAARWHLVGHLQRNKAARAVELFDRIHGVDRAELAEALSRHAAARGRELPVLIEVNVGREAGKFGVAPQEVEALLARVAGLPALRVEGLMMVGPAVGRAEEARPGFARLRGLRDAARRSLGLALPELSMGMSGDFEVAVEEGSTLLRVGTALFGPRA
jgi:pyridoxal phosphate enzyme (YggS family)